MSSIVLQKPLYNSAVDIQLLKEVCDIFNSGLNDAENLFKKGNEIATRMEFLVKHFKENLSQTKYSELSIAAKKIIRIFLPDTNDAKDEKKSVTTTVSDISLAIKNLNINKDKNN
ncbi:MAG: hypothetical protein V4487_05355 [Chlamydiota bacterium]